jgi:asparagine synthase (glutamine-hydrolysing)
MCGITGYLFNQNAVPSTSALFSAMLTLTHRGPDDIGHFEDRVFGVSLGHTRLSILDLSPFGHQPMESNGGKVVLVFNGEIYNFRELRAKLESEGHTFRGHSDTEVLLHLYLDCKAREGDLAEMLRRLNGIFAFAIWDADRGALLLVRDALGVKPLYFIESEGRFAFASEIKAFMSLVPTLVELDAASIQRYLSFLWCPGEGTPFQGVHKLGPGEAMWVREGRVEERFTWYKLPVFQTRSVLLSEAEATLGTVDHLRQAVYRQMIADVPVGAFLSGGLDSSSVVAFAHERNAEIQCFTIESAGGVEEGITDDLPYAKLVAEHLKVPLEVVRIDSTRMAQDLENMVAQLDEPLADPAPLNVLYISRLAREHGIKVMLSGAGGDDLFTGYSRHLALMMEHYWIWLPRKVRSRMENWSLNLDSRRAFGRRLRKLLNGAALDGDARLVNYFLWAHRNDLKALYTPAFRAALGDAVAETPMLDFLAGLPSTVEPLERMLALEQRFFLTDHNLTYTDKMSMAVGVEVRVPFLDLDLVEFAYRIPSRFKQHGADGKWVLKKAMEPYLPHEVIYRPKSGFGAPIRRWMRVELREMLSEILGEASLHRRGLFDPLAVQRLIAANDSGKVDASYTLLSLLCVELWCRRFIDQSARNTLSDSIT